MSRSDGAGAGRSAATGAPAVAAPRDSGLRAARRSDLGALEQLERAAFDTPWSRAALGALVTAPGALTLVIEDAGQAPVACALWTHVLDEAELLRLAVAPALRRQGAARALLAAGGTALAALGCTTCFLEVRADNRPAIALYESAGFHRIGRRRDYYGQGVDALLYAASLG